MTDGESRETRPKGESRTREIRTDGGSESDVERAIRENYPALIAYVTAGDPSLEETREYVEALDRGGADLIELGLPFSEPIAEGPTIQAAINRALDAGTTSDAFFDLVEELDVDAPLLVMTYYNKILQYGGSAEPRSADESAGPRSAERGAAKPRSESAVEPFVERAVEAGLSGIVVPDLPVEESDPLRSACDERGLDLVFIVAPTTEGDRLDRIMSRASGFAYVQARLGTTGARADVSTATHDSLARLEEYAVPKAVGFGVSEGDHAAEIIEAGADGVIVGSALIDIIAESDDPVTGLESKARELKEGAVRGGAEVPEPEQP